MIISGTSYALSHNTTSFQYVGTHSSHTFHPIHSIPYIPSHTFPPYSPFPSAPGTHYLLRPSAFQSPWCYIVSSFLPCSSSLIIVFSIIPSLNSITIEPVMSSFPNYIHLFRLFSPSILIIHHAVKLP